MACNRDIFTFYFFMESEGPASRLQGHITELNSKPKKGETISSSFMIHFSIMGLYILGLFPSSVLSKFV
jgi:hypothetical protein